MSDIFSNNRAKKFLKKIKNDNRKLIVKAYARCVESQYNLAIIYKEYEKKLQDEHIKDMFSINKLNEEYRSWFEKAYQNSWSDPSLLHILEKLNYIKNLNAQHTINKLIESGNANIKYIEL